VKIPPPRRRRKQVTVPVRLALIERRGRILMCRRDGTGLMDGMWELPALDRSSQLTPRGDDGKVDDLLPVARLEPFTSFRHTITYRYSKDSHRTRPMHEGAAHPPLGLRLAGG
jgi:adenine-specific DNA glycosylase